MNDMTVHNLLIFKDPIELAFSNWKRGRDPMGWRSSFIQYHKRLLDLAVPFMTVPYHELADQPAETLASLCGVIGMPFFEGKERFWDAEAHHAFGSLGTRKQLEAGEEGGSARPEYPDAFSEIIPGLRDTIADDQELRALTDTLYERRFSASRPADEKAFSRPWIMPFWYYAKKMRGLYRRFVPEKTGFAG